MRKPYFYASKNAWYVNAEDGRKIRLATDEEDAYRIWQRLTDLGNYKHPNASIVALNTAWLAEFKDTLSELKYLDAIRVLKSFQECVGLTQIAKGIQPSQVRKWLAGRDWSDSRKSDAVAKVKRVLRWAFEQGWIPKNPLAAFSVPKGKPREQLVEVDAHARMIELLKGSKRWRPFIPVLIALRLSGARPINVRTVTAKNVSKDGQRWVFADHKTEAKTGKPLVVYLPACLQTLTAILKANRKRYLFINWEGQPFTKNAIVHRMASLRKRLKLPAKTVAYSYRHTYATDAIVGGEDSAVVAALLGHVDPTMVNKVYGHVAGKHEELAKRANRVAKKRV